LENNRRIIRELGYGLRLLRGFIGVLSAFYQLFQLGDQDTRIIQTFRHDLRRKGNLVPRGWTLNSIMVPWQHYGRLFRSLPRLACRRSREFAEELEKMRRRFEADADVSSERLYLRQDGPARAVQGKFLKHLFYLGFGLPLTAGQTATLSCYADSTLLMREFLNYCLRADSTDPVDSAEALSNTLRDFEEVLKRSLLPNVKLLPVLTDRKGRGSFSSCLANAMNPDWTMVRSYDGRRTLIESTAYKFAATWILDELEPHFSRLEELSLLNFREVTACEMHLQACVLLCDVASVVSDDAASAKISEEFSFALDQLWINFLSHINRTQAKPVELLKG
jgi:hypothetical protein